MTLIEANPLNVSSHIVAQSLSAEELEVVPELSKAKTRKKPG